MSKQGKRIDWGELAQMMGYACDSDMAQNLYFDQGLGPTRISQEIEDWLGLNYRPSPPSVIKWLLRLGYKISIAESRYKGDRVARSHGFKNCKEMLRFYRDVEESWESIAKGLNIPKQTIYNWRDRVGL